MSVRITSLRIWFFVETSSSLSWIAYDIRRCVSILLSLIVGLPVDSHLLDVLLPYGWHAPRCVLRVGEESGSFRLAASDRRHRASSCHMHHLPITVSILSSFCRVKRSSPASASSTLLSVNLTARISPSSS